VHRRCSAAAGAPAGRNLRVVIVQRMAMLACSQHSGCDEVPGSQMHATIPPTCSPAPLQVPVGIRLSSSASKQCSTGVSMNAASMATSRWAHVKSAGPLDHVWRIAATVLWYKHLCHVLPPHAEAALGRRAAANLAAALQAVNLQQPPQHMPTVPEDTELEGMSRVHVLRAASTS
jgi:hypothetical protein